MRIIYTATTLIDANLVANTVTIAGGQNVGSGSFTAATGVINAGVGFRVNNAATSGNILGGDGTNFISRTPAQLKLLQIGANTLTANTTINGTFDWRMGNTTALDTIELMGARVILGGAVTSVGSNQAGSSSTLQADSTATVKADRIRVLGNTSAAEPSLEIGEDADNGSNFVAIKSPASLTTDYTQTLTAATGEIPVALKGSATLDFGSTASSTCSELTITVTGAADGDVVALGIPNSVSLTGAIYTAWVSAADTVTVQYCNTSTVGPGDPSSATFKVQVFK